MSNYLKNVLVGFTRPTATTAEKVVLALNQQNGESFNLFYQNPSHDSKKKSDSRAKGSPRQLSSEAK